MNHQNEELTLKSLIKEMIKLAIEDNKNAESINFTPSYASTWDVSIVVKRKTPNISAPELARGEQ
jgi:hypothetical protein